MKRLLFFVLAGLLSFVLLSCEKPSERKTSPVSIENQSAAKIERLRMAIKAVEPFFKPMGEPEPFDWLETFKESGQTFDEYIGGKPSLPNSDRRKIYIQPIGEIDETQQKVINLTADYMARFFGLPVEMLPAQKFSESLAAQNYRVSSNSKIKQIRTGYVLDEILAPQLPKDASALIAFTSEDLYPDETMNYLFGQASLEKRVGVWSLYRLQDKKRENFKLFLTRTLKIAVHETGHMFSIAHCTKYECVMSGTNHLGETDRRPLDACPECMAKISWAMNYAPQERYERLAEFCQQTDLMVEKDFFTRKAKAIAF